MKKILLLYTVLLIVFVAMLVELINKSKKPNFKAQGLQASSTSIESIQKNVFCFSMKCDTNLFRINKNEYAYIYEAWIEQKWLYMSSNRDLMIEKEPGRQFVIVCKLTGITKEHLSEYYLRHITINDDENLEIHNSNLRFNYSGEDTVTLILGNRNIGTINKIKFYKEINSTLPSH